MVLKYKLVNMAKVILLNGSPRLNSNTQDILEVCAEEIEKNSVETEIISLRGKNILSCIACNKCVDEGNCVLSDGLDEIIEKIKKCRWIHTCCTSLFWNCTWGYYVCSSKNR